MNILFTGAGRRNYVIQDFKEAVGPRGGSVFAMNSHAGSPSLAVADRSFLSPPASDQDYAGFLLEVCSKFKVSSLCTLIDTDMPVLSSLRKELASMGTRLILPDGQKLEICRDKVMMGRWLETEGLPVLKSYLSVRDALVALDGGILSFPLIIKPRFGTGSFATYTIHDEEELTVMARRVIRELEDSPLHKGQGDVPEDRLIIQPFIHGTEYNLDVVNDLKGRYQCTIIKEKISMRSGETDIAVTRRHPELEAFGHRLSSALQHPFLLDVDLIMHEDQPFVLDMNPRIGGGYPFGLMAGVRYAEAFVQWLLNEDADARALLIPRQDLLGMKGISLHQSS